MSKNTFLSSRLINLINSDKTVTSTFASSPPGTSVHSVAESLHSKQSPHQSYDSRSSSAAEQGRQCGETTESTGSLNKVLEKLHMKSTDSDASKKYTDGSTKSQKYDKDVDNPAKEQWNSMRKLNPQELEEVRSYGKWGGVAPSDLFLNVSQV